MAAAAAAVPVTRVVHMPACLVASCLREYSQCTSFAVHDAVLAGVYSQCTSSGAFHNETLIHFHESAVVAWWRLVGRGAGHWISSSMSSGLARGQLCLQLAREQLFLQLARGQLCRQLAREQLFFQLARGRLCLQLAREQLCLQLAREQLCLQLARDLGRCPMLNMLASWLTGTTGHPDR
jgi:hypothetical protein